jgi:endonuclease/exonuclease/phosphatase (EEP) superfamily protein YafD/photosystem II stability/assembly factor-like uncharacterized protein
MRRLSTLLNAAAFLALVPALLAFLGPLHWRLHLLEQLRSHFLLLLLAASIGALLAGRGRWVLLWTAGLLLNAFPLAPLALGDSAPEAAGAPLRVAHCNVHVVHPEPERVLEWIEGLDADFVLLEEVTPEWARLLESGLRGWTVNLLSPRPDPSGIALLVPRGAREGWTTLSAELRQMSEIWGERPAVELRLAGQGVRLAVLGVHLARPVSEFEAQVQAADYRFLQSWCNERRGAGEEVLVLGDFNTSPWSHRFRRLLDASGMRDSLAGRGLQGTWPALLPAWLRLPIDHAVHSPGLVVTERRVGPDLGSDHLPLQLELRVVAAAHELGLAGGLRADPQRPPSALVPGASLRGIDAAPDGAVWASGSGGTVLRQLPGAAEWQRIAVPEAEGLDFRDVEAFSAEEAVLLAAGPGEASRVLRTEDGGASWTETLRNADAEGFYDGMAFWDERRGLLQGDPVDGRFVVWRTEDGGRSWARVHADSLGAGEGEHAFAASGTGITVSGEDFACFVTGGALARAFSTTDGGLHWRRVRLPLVQGRPSAGGFGVAFDAAGMVGLAVGGDYEQEGSGAGSLAVSFDGGRRWSPVSPPAAGFRSGVVALPDGGFVAVGPSGIESLDPRRGSRVRLDAGAHALTLLPDGGIRTSGAGGQLAAFRLDG